LSKAALAEDLKVAIVTINGKLKRQVDQGSIAVKRTQRGNVDIALCRTDTHCSIWLTTAYIRQSFHLYCRLRQQVKDLLEMLNEVEVCAVWLVVDDDVPAICQLTCPEHQAALTDQPEVPAFVVDGEDFRLEWRYVLIMAITKKLGVIDELVRKTDLCHRGGRIFGHSPDRRAARAWCKGYFHPHN